MKAIVQSRYGSPDVLSLADVDMPVPADGEILVRVHASSVNPADWHYVTGLPYLVRIGKGIRTPSATIPGIDVAGRVEAVGRNATLHRPGDDVFGMCGGAFAEYVRVRETGVVPKPANVTYEQAAAAPVASLTALQGLRDRGGIGPGQHVLINGASGGVGTFAVQIAKELGAEVTGVCSTRNVDTIRSLGADHVIDYTVDDFVQSGQRYDLILDIAGNRSIADRRRALRPTGTLVVVGGPDKGRWLGPATSIGKVIVASRFGRHRMVGMMTKNNNADLHLIGDFCRMEEWFRSSSGRARYRRCRKHFDILARAMLAGS